MKKIFKKLLITTALVTPIAISTPLLLTSCSADIQMSVETPPIFGDITPGNLIQSITDEVNGANKKFFVFNITNNDFAEKLENETFNKIWNLTPGPKFDTQVTAIGEVINSSITDANKKIKFTPNKTETIATNVTYDSNVLEIQEQFNAVKTLFSNSRMTNIIESKTTESEGKTLIQGASFTTDHFLKWDKILELKNNIESKLQISVGEGSAIADKPLTTDARISLILTPKNNYVWPGLNTSDPIIMDLGFEQNEKAALFNNGFVNAEPKFDSTADAFVFNATLSKNVFGENSSKVSGTSDIKKWLEDGTFNDTAQGGSSSTNVTSNKISSLSTRIKTIFSNLSEIKNVVNNAVQQPTFEASNLITSYIKGANPVTDAPAEKQNFINKANNHVNGGENILLKSSSTRKKTSDSSNKDYVISLVFALADPAIQEWFGITDSANKSKNIKFDLTVNLGS